MPPPRLVVVLLAAGVVLAGCGSDLSRLDKQPSGDERAGHVLFRGDFEDGLGGWTAQRAAPDRIAIVRSPHAQGRHAARFTVHSGDVVAPGAGTGNRSEVYARGDLEGYPDGEGSVRYYGWCTMLPRDYPIVDSWQVIAQWKNEGAGSPPLLMKLQERTLTLLSQTADGASTQSVWTGDAEPGRWQRFVVRVKWSPDPEVGTIDLWHDGRRVARDVHRATMFREDETGLVVPNYWKLGLYRSSSIEPDQTLFHDGAVVTTSYEDAAAAC